MTLIASNLTTKGKEEFFLNDISFEMSPGKIYTIIGRTLSGKTTLLKTIAGLIAQDSGTSLLMEITLMLFPFGSAKLQWYISSLLIIRTSMFMIILHSH